MVDLRVHIAETIENVKLGLQRLRSGQQSPRSHGSLEYVPNLTSLRGKSDCETPATSTRIVVSGLRHQTNVKKRRGVRWLPQSSLVVELRLDDGVELEVLRRHGT